MGNISGTEHFSKELELLLFFLNEEFDNKKPSEYKSMIVDIDWNHFLQLTLHHRVFPILYIRLNGINELVPKHVFEKLKKYYQSNILKMLMLSGESESLSKRLSEKNIRSIFLKGSILAADLYGDISLRTSSDIDLLIPIGDLEQTESTLLNMGYVKDDYILTILNDWKWRHHHITFIHPMKKIKVEIHWRLNPGPSFNPSFEDLWNRKKRSLITNFPVYMLGNEDLFVFLSSHGARHGWSRLRWLMDIHMLIQQDLNWDSVKKLLKKYHLCSIGGQALILSGELFHSHIPHGLDNLIARKKSNQLASDAMFYIKQLINLHDEPLPIEVSKYHQRHLYGQMSSLHKTLFIMSFFYPYPEDAQALPLPKSFHFLYFPLRPFIWAWRRKHKHAML